MLFFWVCGLISLPPRRRASPHSSTCQPSKAAFAQSIWRAGAACRPDWPALHVVAHRRAPCPMCPDCFMMRRVHLLSIRRVLHAASRLGHDTRHFNVGAYRRTQKGAEEVQDASFFDHANEVNTLSLHSSPFPPPGRGGGPGRQSVQTPFTPAVSAWGANTGNAVAGAVILLPSFYRELQAQACMLPTWNSLQMNTVVIGPHRRQLLHGPARLFGVVLCCYRVGFACEHCLVEVHGLKCNIMGCRRA